MPHAQPCRFGDFWFDPASGELKGPAGVSRLQPQVAALLVALLDRAGEVVTRAELQASLWPDTNVEFDDGLNTCMRQLRVALGDDAGAPKYVETLPRRGYRFIAPVSADGAPATPPRPRTGRRQRAVVVGAVLVVLVTVVSFAMRGQLRGTAGGAPIVLAVRLFDADPTDSVLVAYQRRLFDRLVHDAAADSGFAVVADSSRAATHVLSGTMTHRGNSVQMSVYLAPAGDLGAHLWADDVTDAYAFSGNSTVTADRLESAVARVLRAHR